MTHRPLALLVSALLIAAPVAPVAGAAELRGVLTDFSLATWGLGEGLPSSVIWAIAQDQDGYLWLGTEAGPVRFDGIRFATWETLGLPAPLKAPVRALLSAGDGSIWLGYGGEGGVSRLHNGQIRHYGLREGLAPTPVTLLFEHPAGVVWAGNDRGLYRLRADRWERDEGVPATPVYEAHVDGTGRFLVGTAMGVFRRNPDSTRFEATGLATEPVRGIDQDADGTVWVSDEALGFRELQARQALTHSADRARGSRLLYDRRGNLWVGTFGRGLWRVRPEPGNRTRTVEKTTALTGFTVTSLTEDRDGNLWVGTADGLNRLTPHKVTPLTDLGLVRGLAAAPDGSIWVGTADSLFSFPGGDVLGRASLAQLPAPLSAIHADRRGTIWVGTQGHLFRVDGGRLAPVPFPREHQPSNIHSIASDSQGRVWIHDFSLGLIRVGTGELRGVALPAHLRAIPSTLMHVDRTDRIWLAFENGWLAIFEKSGESRFSGPADRPGAGSYQAIHEDENGAIWLGGTEGLSRFADGRFAVMQAASGLPAGPITAIVEDDQGEMWVGIHGAAIVQLRRSELERALDQPAYRPRYNAYDQSDGLAGTPRWFRNRSAARASDGRLWFVGSRGVTVIDPKALPMASAPGPPVRIESAYVDDQRLAPLPRIELLPGTTRLEIQYAVLNLTTPLKTRYRHRLEGFDADWIDAGTRREAFYTSLPPREYQFQVMASSADGTWTQPAAVWDFTIAPMFYQTTWFAVMCLAFVVASVAGSWHLHLRRVRREFALLLGERARLSREIHDTLLQSLVGVALQFDAVASDLDASVPPRKEDFVRMRKNVEQYIREARQSIWDLRSPKLRTTDLITALNDAGEHATAGRPVEFEMAVTGTPRPWSERAEEQLLRIGQEAILNAVRHADAKRICVELAYSDESVALRVRDDGRGFDPELVAEVEGHYGLVGMKERARETGGGVTISSRVGRGTEVEAVVPASEHS